MKKLISFTMFLTLVLVVLLAKTSQAQIAVVHVRSIVGAPTKIWVNGYWKWNPRIHRHVWIDGHWTHRHYARRSMRVRAAW